MSLPFEVGFFILYSFCTQFYTIVYFGWKCKCWFYRFLQR